MKRPSFGGHRNKEEYQALLLARDLRRTVILEAIRISKHGLRSEELIEMFLGVYRRTVIYKDLTHMRKTAVIDKAGMVWMVKAKANAYRNRVAVNRLRLAKESPRRLEEARFARRIERDQADDPLIAAPMVKRTVPAGQWTAQVTGPASVWALAQWMAP